MKKLHWLPIESRIQYKVLVLVHACVHNIAPPYLSILLTRYVPSRGMWSSGKLILHQPIPNMVTYGTIVFNISLLQYVQLVSNVSLSCILYMLLPFDVGIIYFFFFSCRYITLLSSTASHISAQCHCISAGH